ncbi:MAG: HNH endonuclease [Taibaiella sp.]|nr:HNH endonuclease [Taibaiella sp.]
MEYSDKRELGVICTEAVRKEILFLYMGRCFLCGIEEWRTKASHQMHRVTPGKEGGVYVLSNLIPVCRACHKHVEGQTWQKLLLVRHPLTHEASHDNI